ncbi:MAG: hypothetical protein CMI06_04020 [Oceanospirillaceae bacterium]|jgi:uncharacterized RDD family membrane protein YckC|nr:hypothetical protein [Oceanospirillaceae bacterium]
MMRACSLPTVTGVVMSDQNYPTAPLSRRLAALAYDALVLIALYIMLGGLLVTAVSKIIGSPEFVRLSPAMSMSVMFTICFLYYSHSWRRGGQTIGMKAWGLKLLNDNNKGTGIQLSQCMLRTGVGFFSLLFVGLGFWWMLFDKQQRSWHDIASLTRMVYIPKNMK